MQKIIAALLATFVLSACLASGDVDPGYLDDPPPYDEVGSVSSAYTIETEEECYFECEVMHLDCTIDAGGYSGWGCHGWCGEDEMDTCDEQWRECRDQCDGIF
ncbi:MAG: lipoprotein [Myxococcota bacterium]